MDEMDVSGSISFKVSVQTTVSKLHMELDRPAHWRTQPGGGEPRTLTSGAPIPEPAARPAAAQPRSPARYATHRKLDGSEDVDQCDSRFPGFQPIEQQRLPFEQTPSNVVEGRSRAELQFERRQATTGNLIGELPRVGTGLRHEAATELSDEWQDRCRQAMQIHAEHNTTFNQHSVKPMYQSGIAQGYYYHYYDTHWIHTNQPMVDQREYIRQIQTLHHPPHTHSTEMAHSIWYQQGVKGAVLAQGQRGAGGRAQVHGPLTQTVMAHSNWYQQVKSGAHIAQTGQRGTGGGLHLVDRSSRQKATKAKAGTAAAAHPGDGGEGRTALWTSTLTSLASPGVGSSYIHSTGERKMERPTSSLASLGSGPSYNIKPIPEEHTVLTPLSQAYPAVLEKHCQEAAAGIGDGLGVNRRGWGHQTLDAHPNPQVGDALQVSYEWQITPNGGNLPHLQEQVMFNDAKRGLQETGKHCYGWGQSQGADCSPLRMIRGIMEGIESVQSAGATLVQTAGDALLQAAAAGQSVRITVGGSAVRALSGLPTPPHEQSQFRAGEDMELLGHGLGWS